MFRTLISVAAVALLAASPAVAAGNDEVLAPIRAFVAALDRNDMAAAAAAHVAAPSIIDEFPAHHWNSFAGWGADFGKDAAAHGDTDPRLDIVKVGRVLVEGDHAYAVVKTNFSFKRKGKPMMEHGTITYALDKTADGWRIAAWTWTW
jgi:ketosteroid isomerase-like protein